MTIVYYLIVYVCQKSKWAQLSSLLRLSQGQDQGVTKHGIFFAGSGGDSDSKFIQVVGRVHFHRL